MDRIRKLQNVGKEKKGMKQQRGFTYFMRTYAITNGIESVLQVERFAISGHAIPIDTLSVCIAGDT